MLPCRRKVPKRDQSRRCPAKTHTTRHSAVMAIVRWVKDKPSLIHAQNCPFLVVTYNLSIGACQMPCVASRAVTPVQACQSYERKTHSCAITAPIHGSAVVGILRPSCNERAGPVQDWRDGTHGYQQPELTRLPLRLGEQKLKDLDKPKCERAAR